MPTLNRREHECKYHEGHKRVIGRGRNWHTKRKKVKAQAKMFVYVVQKYGEKAWHGE